MSKHKRRQPKNRGVKPSRFLQIFVIAVLAIGIIGGGLFALTSFNAKAQPNQSEIASVQALNETDLAVPVSNKTSGNSDCPYDTPFFPKPVEARMETHLRLDLSQGGKAHYVNLIVPSDELSFLADDSIKINEDLQVGDVVLMTGDKVGVIESVEHQLYTPQPKKTDGKGNVFSRVLGKSERFTEEILYLYTSNEVIKTTAEHPFFVDGEWIEAGNLQSGDQIRTRVGSTATVKRTEERHEPQMVYSLLVEDTHNFYVGTEGLLAHNCTPTVKNARVLNNPLEGATNPNSIRFTQDSIRGTFKNGNSVQDTIAALKSGSLSADAFPAIRVFEVDGQLFSLDNRRLYVFQQAGVPINAVPATAQEIANESFKFTTKNGGVSIRVRGGQ